MLGFTGCFVDPQDKATLETPFDEQIIAPIEPVEPPQDPARKVKITRGPGKKKLKIPDPDGKRSGKPLPGLPTGKYHTAEKIFKYWNDLPIHEVERTVLYVYRKWPVIDRTRVNPDNETNIEKYYSPFPLENIVRAFGSGDYSFRLNDTMFARGTVMQTHRDKPYSVRDSEYPPQLNYDELIIDPNNTAYLAKLKQQGIKVPCMEGAEDSDMATNNAAMETMATTIKDLASRPPQVTATPIRDNTEQSAQKMGMETMAKACEAAITLVTAHAGTNQRAADPMETVNAVVKIAQEMAPKPDGSQAVLMKEMMEANRQLTGQIADQNNRRIETLERELQSSRRAVEAVSPAQAPKSFLEQMKEYREFKSVAGDILGTGGDEDDDHKGKRGGAPWWADLIPVAGPVLIGLGQLVANAMYNSAVAKGGPGTAQPPPPVGGLTPDQQAMAQQAGMVPVQQHPYPQQQQEQNQMFNPFAKYHAVLEDVRRPLLDSFNNLDSDFPGADFAQQIIQFRGRELYDQLKKAGPDDLLVLLQSYPPVWGAMSLDIARVQKFLTDFIRYDEIAEQWARETEQPEPEIVPRRVVKIPQA